MNPLDPMTVPFEKRLLIEASAGTGKTYTISLLYLRLLLDQSLTVDQILVVTYTHAATDELRLRILNRLKEAVAAYENPELASNEYLRLLEQYPSTPERILILKRGLLNFDEAAIYTIHSFCQRALKENAFDVGMPFESELINDEQELLINLADSFWHRHLLKPNALQEAVIRHNGCTPDELLTVVKPYIGRPYLDRQPKALLSAQTYNELNTEVMQLWQELNTIWVNQKDKICDLLLNPPNPIRKGTYTLEVFAAFSDDFSKMINGVAPKKLDTLEKLTYSYIAERVSGKKAPPEHIFYYELQKAWLIQSQLKDALDKGFDQLCYDLMLFLREKLPQRKSAIGVLAFDDLLVNLQIAVSERPTLAQQLVKDYPAALIDEFQDTDPIQYDVFDKIYKNRGVLVFVGDPKQAIYAFRGADIHTYLRASQEIESTQHYTLDRNFRSTPELLTAFNEFFKRSKDPFRNELSVAYETIKAGKSNLVFQSPISAPLRFWTWQPKVEDTNAKYTVRQVEKTIAEAVASDIAKLLIAAQKGEVLIGEGEPRPLESRDIAILVRNHKQGKLMSDALQAHHIASSQRSKDHIFATPEAHELRLLLEAIVEPRHEAKLRRALTTELLGGTVQTLLDLEHSKETDNHLLECWVERFNHWHILWVKQGFMSMFQDWLQSPTLLDKHLTQQQHLLRFIDGERRLTNLWHIAELVYNEIRHGAKSMHALVRWLMDCAEQSGTEDNQLRLESDEALIQIVTIHKSKGLQYPVIYCPFLWGGEGNINGWFSYYDLETGQTSLFASKFDDEERKNAKELCVRENQQESLRLIYVALTRAIYHCTVVVPTGAMDRFDYDTGLYWLLYGHLNNSEALLSTATSEVAKKAKLTSEDRTQIFNQELASLVVLSQGNMSCEPLPEIIDELKVSLDQTINVKPPRLFKTIPPKPQRVDSFSSLSSDNHYETPDYDGDWGSTSNFTPDDNQFPAGKLAGVCLHKVLEELDFKASLESQSDKIKSTLVASGFNELHFNAAIQLLNNTLNTPLQLGKELKLSIIDKEQRLDELEFYFPINYLNVRKLQQVLNDYTPESKVFQRQAIQRLKFQDAQGFMKGFIDLIFEYKGRYYIVDYKSNRLADTPSEYTKERMEETIGESHYYLQYLIYCVALQRYLKMRLADQYDYNSHFGGVFYLFLRGMQPHSNSSTGIYSTRPKAEFINALDDVFSGVAY
jgi:exodeoxyribonuclease V beta subunit